MTKKIVKIINTILENLEKIMVLGITAAFILNESNKEFFIFSILGSVGIVAAVIWLIWVLYFGRRLITIWPSSVRKRLKHIKFETEGQNGFILAAIVLTLVYLLVMYLNYKEKIFIGSFDGAQELIYIGSTIVYIPCLLLLFTGRNSVLPDFKQILIDEFGLTEIESDADNITLLRAKEYVFLYGIEMYKSEHVVSGRRKRKIELFNVKSKIILNNKNFEDVKSKVDVVRSEYDFILIEVFEKENDVEIKMENLVWYSNTTNAKYVVGTIISMCNLAEDIVRETGESAIDLAD